MSAVTERHPCPCEACDRYALSADQYCIACLHEGCGPEVECR